MAQVEGDHSIFGKGRIPVSHWEPVLPREVEDDLMRQIRGEGVGFSLPSLPNLRPPTLSFEHYSTFSGYDAQIGTPDPEVSRGMGLVRGVRDLLLKVKQRAFRAATRRILVVEQSAN